MQEKHLYEYSVIRLLPVLEREEFINVGIILFSKKAKYINLLYDLNEEKIRLFCPLIDLGLVKQNMSSFELIAKGDKKGGQIAEMDLPSRFRWLTAVRSSAIQTSRPHPGLTENLEETANKLFEELVK
jgi:hypothetical protein